jgi:hypothetical protein
MANNNVSDIHQHPCLNVNYFELIVAKEDEDSDLLTLFVRLNTFNSGLDITYYFNINNSIQITPARIKISDEETITLFHFEENELPIIAYDTSHGSTFFTIPLDLYNKLSIFLNNHSSFGGVNDLEIHDDGRIGLEFIWGEKPTHNNPQGGKRKTKKYKTKKYKKTRRSKH